jgi:hypothetical protein
LLFLLRYRQHILTEVCAGVIENTLWALDSVAGDPELCGSAGITAGDGNQLSSAVIAAALRGVGVGRGHLDTESRVDYRHGWASLQLLDGLFSSARERGSVHAMSAWVDQLMDGKLLPAVVRVMKAHRGGAAYSGTRGRVFPIMQFYAMSVLRQLLRAAGGSRHRATVREDGTNRQRRPDQALSAARPEVDDTMVAAGVLDLLADTLVDSTLFEAEIAEVALRVGVDLLQTVGPTEHRLPVGGKLAAAAVAAMKDHSCSTEILALSSQLIQLLAQHLHSAVAAVASGAVEGLIAGILQFDRTGRDGRVAQSHFCAVYALYTLAGFASRSMAPGWALTSRYVAAVLLNRADMIMPTADASTPANGTAAVVELSAIRQKHGDNIELDKWCTHLLSLSETEDFSDL